MILMNNEKALIIKIKTYNDKLFYVYIKIKQHNGRINIYTRRIKLTEFEEGVLQCEQNDYLQFSINENKLIKNKSKECKKCKFYTFCLKTQEKSNIKQVDICIIAINKFIENKNCKYNKLNKNDKDFEILQIKEYMHTKGSDLIKESD